MQRRLEFVRRHQLHQVERLGRIGQRTQANDPALVLLNLLAHQRFQEAPVGDAPDRRVDFAQLFAERFQRIAPDKVRWTVTVDDPSTWTRPWTFSLPLTADPNPLPLYECHEGNYGLKNILSAARAEEQQK